MLNVATDNRAATLHSTMDICYTVHGDSYAVMDGSGGSSSSSSNNYTTRQLRCPAAGGTRMGWTIDGFTLLKDGEPVGVFETVREMDELAHRLRVALEDRTGSRLPGMYTEEDQELYVLKVLRNLHTRGTVAERAELVRHACRAYRGIDSKELDRILGRLIVKGLVVESVGKGVNSTRARRCYALASMRSSSSSRSA